MPGRFAASGGRPGDPGFARGSIFSILEGMLPRLLGAAGAIVLAGAAFSASYPKVPDGHPRVYVRPADLPELRAKISLPEFRDSWERIKNSQADPRHGYFFSAFVYLVTGDEQAGRRAVENGLSAVKGSTDARTYGMPFHLTAIVYDWCYALLTAAEKNAERDLGVLLATARARGSGRSGGHGLRIQNAHATASPSARNSEACRKRFMSALCAASSARVGSRSAR